MKHATTVVGMNRRRNVFFGLVELYRNRELLGIWSLREIRSRYIQSIFGLGWALFQPLSLTVMFVIVFSYFLRLPSDGIPYPIFVYTATLPWNFLSRSITGGVNSIVGNMGLVTKIYFPRSILPLSLTAAYFVDFMIGLLVFLAMMIFYRIHFNITMVMLPVLLLIQLLLTAGVSFGFGAITVYYRDMMQMTPLFLQIWMYASPVIYPVSQVPPRLLPIYMLNPMAVIINAYREVTLKGNWPDMVQVGIATLISLLVFVIGYYIFIKLEDNFADVI